jgi:3-oxoacyl-[acyl-carrier protein] reductase
MSELETVTRQRVALITGGNQGIGMGVARLLHSEGWRVHVTTRQESKRAALEETLGAGSVHVGDLTDRGDAARIVGEVVAAEGQLDAVVHSVGPYQTSVLSETAPDVFETMFQGNLMTAVHVVDAAREHLRASAGAYVFFGCSGLERWRARTVTTAYISAKAALLVFMRGLALEEAPHGVRANMISPGFVPHDGAAPDTLSPELQAKIPQGRPAKMEEVAATARWLISEESGHMLGQNLEVSGGWML